MNEAQPSDRFLAPGTRVRLNGAGSERPEYGVVVHCWLDDEIGMHDCYVAFFGDEVPKGRPDETPYILRYAARSLAAIQP